MNSKENNEKGSENRKSSYSTKDTTIRDSQSDLTHKITLANIRHETRTPLNAIIGYSEMLLEDAEALQQENLIPGLQEIHSAGKEMLTTVNEILHPSHMGSIQQDVDWGNLGAQLIRALRTPLNTVIQSIEKLIETIQVLGHSDVVSDLEKIRASSKSFLAYIMNTAHFSEIKSLAENSDLEGYKTSSIIEDIVSDILPLSGEDTSTAVFSQCAVLVVDDNEMNRDLLSRHLERQGHTVTIAEDGHQALEIIKTDIFDIILLDILMPKMNGYQVLHRLKKNETLRNVPVIMISALEEMDIVARCIEVGADDYLVKPFNPVLLSARINSCLERKRLHDLEREQKRILSDTFAKYVAQEVRDEVLSGKIPLDGEIKDVSVLFADLRDFTPLTESTSPKDVVRMLNTYFSEMAPVIQQHRGSILRYVGDEIYAVFGAPLPLKDHPNCALGAALDMRRLLEVVNKKLEQQNYPRLNHGIGIHSGLVVAANIGSPERLAYDFVGDTVNLASRIQNLTKKFNADILISSTTRDRITDYYPMEKLPAVIVKGMKNPVELFRVI